jgi:hypothetical protein
MNSAEVYRSDEKENLDPVKAAQHMNTTTENKYPFSTAFVDQASL